MNDNTVSRSKAESGRATLSALIEALVVVAIVPPLLCCALNAAVLLVGIVLPWIALVLISAALGACLAAVALTRRLPPPGPDQIPPPVLPPIRRPPGIQDRRPPDRY